MKKILTVILLTTMLMPYAYAAEVDVYDVDDIRVQEAINFFDDLGLVSIYKDNSFRGFEKVTRRDMAILIHEMLGGGVGSCNYKDVSSDDAGYDAIGFVTGRANVCKLINSYYEKVSLRDTIKNNFHMLIFLLHLFYEQLQQLLLQQLFQLLDQMVQE